MKATLSVPQWLQLSSEVRAKLIELFNIPRTGVGHIDYTGKGAEVKSDGHTHKDLEAISVEAMQQYLHSTNEDFFELFNIVVKLLEYPEQFSDAPAPAIIIKESEPEIKIRWVKTISDLKIEAEEKGLLVEFKKLLKDATIQKKPQA